MKFFLSLFIALTTTLAAEAQCSSGGCSSGGAGLFGRRAPATYYVPAVTTYSYAQPAPVVTSSPTKQVVIGTRQPETHTHTCPSCGVTWDHKSNPVGAGDKGHICPNCNTVQKWQDTSPRPVTVFQSKTYTPAVAITKSKDPCPECEAAAAKLKAEEAKSVVKEEKREENTLPDGYKWFKDPDGKWQALKLKTVKEPEATMTTGTEVANAGWVKTETGFQKVK